MGVMAVSGDTVRRSSLNCVNIILTVLLTTVLILVPPFAGLLKELLKSEHFVSTLMNNSKTEEETENPNFLEGENPLPLVLKKVIAEAVVNCWYTQIICCKELVMNLYLVHSASWNGENFTPGLSWFYSHLRSDTAHAAPAWLSLGAELFLLMIYSVVVLMCFFESLWFSVWSYRSMFNIWNKCQKKDLNL